MSTITEVETTPQAVEELAGRIFMEGIGALHLGSVYIGVKHGLFAMLAEDEPLTANALAARTGLDGWYVREWLQAETTADRPQPPVDQPADDARHRHGHPHGAQRDEEGVQLPGQHAGARASRRHRGSAKRSSTRPIRRSSEACHLRRLQRTR